MRIDITKNDKIELVSCRSTSNVRDHGLKCSPRSQQLVVMSYDRVDCDQDSQHVTYRVKSLIML